MSQIETTRELTRAAVADYLREFADELDAERGRGTTGDADRTTGKSADREGGPGTTDDRTARQTDSERAPTDDPSASSASGGRTYDKVTILVGNDSATVNPPETVDFEVAVDSDSSLMEAGERQRVSLVMEWDAREVDDGDDDIEII